MPSIILGDDTFPEVHGRGSINVSEGTFHDVLCIPYLLTNLLSIYHNTYIGSSKQVEFTLDTMVISEMRNRSTTTMGKEENQSILYHFSHFVPNSPSLIVLTHSDEVSHLWHQQFGHLNYCYLQKLSQDDMVTRFPSIQFFDGLC